MVAFKKVTATLKNVNEALKKSGAKERLVRGRGYYYFIDGDAFSWRSQSVYVYRVSDLTIDGWLAEHAYLSSRANRVG